VTPVLAYARSGPARLNSQAGEPFSLAVRPFFGRFKKPSQQGFSELKSSVRVFGVSPSGNIDDQARVLSTCLSSRRENANARAEKIAKKTNSNEIGFARLRKDKDNAVI